MGRVYYLPMLLLLAVGLGGWTAPLKLDGL